ncbi:hypothetical protein [Apis mellifera associated microvirus 24]|nr:hypothetical protein [Apis mellifera associated microvirus 24]
MKQLRDITSFMDVKKQAKLLTREMRKLDPSYKLSQAYEALAHQAGYSSWNHYSAKLKQQRDATAAYRKRKDEK